MEHKPPRFLGIPNRYLILLIVVASAFLFTNFFGIGLGLDVVSPFVQLPAEYFAEEGFGHWLTNTLVATAIAYVILLIIAFGVRRAAASGELVPRGFSGAVEALVEGLYNMTEATAGKWAKTIIPWFAGITLLVLVVNWMELIPGVDSLGLYIPHHAEERIHEAGAHAPEEEAHGDEGDHHYPLFDTYCTHSTFIGMTAVGGAGEVEGEDYSSACSAAIVPFVRVASTDLNFTAALAVISVVMTQVIGVRALGIRYFQKFWYTKTLFTKPIFGVIDFAVGLLEIIAEIAKILSFSFRLFGNIFAGSVLLFVIGSLVPIFAQSIFLMLEFFVGLIQAVVFGMLTMVFMSQATHSHHDDGEEHH